MPSFFTTFIPFVVIELQRHRNPFLLTLKQTCLLVNQSMCSPGGYSRFQVTGMIECGEKSNPPKISVPKCNPPKNPMPNFRAIKFPESIKWYNYNESSDCFEYPKNSLLKSSCLKNTCQNFPTPQKSWIQNFKPQKTLRPFLSLEIWSTPPGAFTIW